MSYCQGGLGESGGGHLIAGKGYGIWLIAGRGFGLLPGGGTGGGTSHCHEGAEGQAQARRCHSQKYDDYVDQCMPESQRQTVNYGGRRWFNAHHDSVLFWWGSMNVSNEKRCTSSLCFSVVNCA